MKVKYTLLSIIFLLSMIFHPIYIMAETGEIAELTCEAAVLMEPVSGQIIYSKNMDTKRSPASITKIMTLLLIFEEIENGNLSLTDEVITSAHAKSMGGSQIFLEEGEKQNVETMIKAIVIASGNDASVAMAEHIGGSEEAFVEKMNQKAKALQMENTHFVDCCGLTESTDHYTTAQDVAIMSRELINHFPQVLQYSSIWQEEITHTTAKGTKPFTLTNTNKLIRGYEGCQGLKTGSTSIAKYCVSAVATRNQMTLISVILGAQDHKIRFREAADLLNYGFGKCRLLTLDAPIPMKPIKLTNVYGQQLDCSYSDTYAYVSTNKEEEKELEAKVKIPNEIAAPVKKGEIIGYIYYYVNDKEVGKVPVKAKMGIQPSDYGDCCWYLIKNML